MSDCHARGSDHRGPYPAVESHTCARVPTRVLGGGSYVGANCRLVTFLTDSTWIFALCVSLAMVLDGTAHQESMEKPLGSH